MITVESREILAALTEHVKHADALAFAWTEQPVIECTKCEAIVVRFRLPRGNA
jgi:hypothetical protein